MYEFYSQSNIKHTKVRLHVARNNLYFLLHAPLLSSLSGDQNFVRIQFNIFVENSNNDPSINDMKIAISPKYMKY